ncbi:uncharacterized protein HKW66_Vig0053050 [Vigna angularis]|uniref:Uncharacterized protein n=1 Tax=Phaseolus angularis TaxID=3914 RepID=A0A8T0L081_PHAAN|nr:uncharacterized protein HKW66_Vig0053050 [Vigna angularis]
MSVFDLQVMENERTCEFCFWCVNGEDKDMWVALGLIYRRFARLELREVEENVRNLQQQQHLGCGRILVFCRFVCDFLVIDGEEDDLVAVNGGLLRTGGEDGGNARWWPWRLAADDEVEVVEIGFGGARIDVTVPEYARLAQNNVMD